MENINKNYTHSYGIFQGKEISDLLFQISIILFLITIFSIGIYMNWSYGLKKYEAYG
jgi:hypothetical protein